MSTAGAAAGAIVSIGMSTGDSWGAATGPFTRVGTGAPVSTGAAPSGTETGVLGAPRLDGALAIGGGEPSGELTGKVGLTGTGDTGLCSGLNTGDFAGVLVVDGATTGTEAGAKSEGGAVKKGDPVTLPSNGGDMDRTGVGAATGTANGAGVMVHRLGAPGVPLSPPIVHRVVELHQFFPNELSSVSFLRDMEEPTSLGKLGPLSHSTLSTSAPVASFIMIISTSPREKP
jgi:hypothetical protein